MQSRVFHNRGMVILFTAIIALTAIVAASDVKNVWAVCSCCPIATTTNEPMEGSLLEQIVKQTIVAKYKQILADKFNFEYLTGLFANYNILNSVNFDTLTNFMPQISTITNINIADQLKFIDTEISFDVFSRTLNNAVSGTASSVMSSYAMGGDFYETLPTGVTVVVVDTFIPEYERWLASPIAVNTYKSEVLEYDKQLAMQIQHTSEISKSFFQLGSRVDIGQSALQEKRIKNNIRAAKQEAIKLGQGGVAMVDNIFGEGVRNAIKSPYGYAKNYEDFVGKNKIYINNAFGANSSGLFGMYGNSVKLCKQTNNGYMCAEANSQIVDDIVSQANNAAVTVSGGLTATVQAGLNSMIEKGYSNMLSSLEPNIHDAVTIVFKYVDSSSAGEFMKQDMYKNIQNDILSMVSDVNAVHKETKAAVQQSSLPTDIKSVSAIIAWNGEKTPPKPYAEFAVNRYIAGRRAVDVANTITEYLKSVPIQDIDSRSDDQAWKDFNRLYYYWIILQDETTKLQSVTAMSSLMSKDPDLSKVVKVNKWH